MDEQQRKKRLFNRILLVCGFSAVLYFAGYAFFTHRAPRYYYFPEGFTGWVTVRFEKQGAPALEKKDGAWQLMIPESGILETSSRYESGWSRDAYFWKSGTTIKEIPKDVYEGEHKRHVHDIISGYINYDPILSSLPETADTLLWEGSRVRKRGPNVDIKNGRTLMEHLYVTFRPEPYFFVHDTLPGEQKIW